VTIGIVGGGIAGLSAARALQDQGLAPVVFDKARGPGGRLSSRRSELGDLDLGAQYATARAPEFRASVFGWLRAGVARRWSVTPAVRPPPRKRFQRRGPARYVGIPRMNAIARHLAADLDLRTATAVTSVANTADGVAVRDAEGAPIGCFDHVIVTAPAPQALAMAPPADADTAAAIEGVRFAPCWAVAFEIPGADGLPDACFVNDGPIQWLTRHGARPERPEGEVTWIVHANAAWSREWLEASGEAVAEALYARLREQWADLPQSPARTVAHRWRYARVENPMERGSLTDSQGISYAGDWVADGRLEGAWLSGRRAAQRLIELGGA